MRALVLVVLFAFVGCKHEPAVKTVEQPVNSRDGSPIRPGELIVGTFEPVGVDKALELSLLEGYRFEYVAAATETMHLMKAMWADGTSLTEDETRALAEKLLETNRFKFVELNKVKAPR